MKADFDVIVVGAGPSGTAAAWQLSRCGYRVLMLDKATFPRVKPCGGGITIKALDLLPYSVGAVIERATRDLRMGVKTSAGGREELFSGDAHICVFAIRAEFDRFNFRNTLQQGAEFQLIGELEAVEQRPDHVAVAVDGKKISARFLIGADGANSATRRLLSAGRFFHRGFAIEGQVSYADLGVEPVPEFLFGVVRNGYGWLFPKRTHVNVGIYTFDSNVPLSKHQLREYAVDRLGTDRISDIIGFPLGFGGRNYAPNSERIILVGDAAGFAEPLLGEGIHNALKSGQAAAAAIIEADQRRLPGLRRAYMRTLEPVIADLARCEQMRDLFYRHLDGVGSTALRLPVGRTALMRGFAAGKTMVELTNRFLFARFFVPKIPKSLRDFLDRDQGQPGKQPLPA
ncbi:MAG TPA: geranylgeranyl reductase family protein [Bradyrhizobium sp.]|jgi:geranylgeranyl reductase family protein|nr:geranylgeranyl reductase family protein [Bradyrhizobium sp.]